MKILLVIDSLGPGGAQRQMTLLAKGLTARGHDVSVFVYYPHIDHFRGELIKAGVDVIDGVKQNRLSMKPARAIRKLVVANKVKAVVSFLDAPNVYSILGTIGLDDVRVIVSERLGFIGGLPLATRLRYFLYRFADHLTMNSWHHLEQVQTHFSSLTGQSSVIYNAVDLDRFSPARFESADKRRPLTLVAIASLQRKKNAKNLIKAIAICRDRGLSVKLSWYGATSGTAEMDEEFAECSALINACQIDELWSWRGIARDIPQVLGESTAVVHPSLFEGLSNVVCESLACGKVVLCGSISDHESMMGAGRGILFDPMSADSIANAIADLANLTDEEVQVMESAARAFAVENFHPTRFAGAYESLLAPAAGK